MKTRDGETFQAEIRDIRYIAELDPPISDDVLAVFHEFAASTWAWRAEPCGQWMVHDPANARIVFGLLRHDVLTVWTLPDVGRPLLLPMPSTLGSGPA